MALSLVGRRIAAFFSRSGLSALTVLGAAQFAVAQHPGSAPILPGVDDTELNVGGGPLNSAPVVVCFAEGTDPNYVAQVTNLVNLMNGNQYFLGGRWSGSQGTPRALTWSFVPDGLSIPGGVGEPTAASNLFAQMDSKFSGQGGRATWVLRIQQCFDRWEQVAGLTFTRVTSAGNDWDDGAAWGSGASATRGDIRISMHAVDGASNTLGYTTFPSSGDMVLDSAESWGTSTNLHIFLRNTVMHELGHAFGLAHVCSTGSGFLMEPLLATNFDGPQHDDIRAIERHYGDPFESDNSAATAHDLGTIATGLTVSNTCTTPAALSFGAIANTSVCSIDADAKSDFFKFTLLSAASVTVTVTPLGFTYNDNVQAANGSCTTGATTNSLSIADLNVRVLASNGITVLADANTAAAGVAESAANVAVAAGVAFIQVYEGSSPLQSQLYRISIAVQASCTGLPDCNGNAVLDSCDIANGTSLDTDADGVPDECQSGPFCFGDGSIVDHTSACPCGNFGDSGHGCSHSFSFAGALLTATGTAANDDVVLQASDMPATAFGLYMQHDAPGDQVFHDGILCAGGTLTRLRGRPSVGGASMFPDSSFANDATLTLSQRGGVTPGSGVTRFYATWYRNASTTFCPPATANVTNGWRVVW